MNPTPKEIKQARKRAKLTQRGAAALIYKEAYSWAAWEQGRNNMHWGDWVHFHSKAKLEMK